MGLIPTVEYYNSTDTLDGYFTGFIKDSPRGRLGGQCTITKRTDARLSPRRRQSHSAAAFAVERGADEVTSRAGRA